MTYFFVLIAYKLLKDNRYNNMCAKVGTYYTNHRGAEEARRAHNPKDG
jgi:hypothetical protein